ncbi:MAG: hypothetical protein HQ541_11185 [Mariniphaga sp.]|nr:hypothetical protein [Mariniphaga sp.]
MNNPELILLKITICLILLFGIYYFLLRKETTFRFIRFFLLFSILASVAFPFIPLQISWSPPPLLSEQLSRIEPDAVKKFITPEKDINNSSEINIEPINTDADTKKTPWLLYAYILGFTLLTTRFLINISKLSTRIQKNKKLNNNGITCINIKSGRNIHSFFRFIFLPDEHFDNPKNSIIEHEKIHVNQLHSIDILIIELIQIIFWFHPLIYLYRNAIILNHEFLADEGVLKAQVGKIEYQQSLLDYCIAKNELQFTSGFNFTHIKKRIAMMTKTRKKQNSIIKPLVSLSFAILLFVGLSLKEKASNAMYAEFNTPVFIEEPVTIDYEPSELIVQEKQDPVLQDKKAEFKKLMVKRDSVLKTAQLKMQKAQKLAQLKQTEIMVKLEKQLQKEQFKAQKMLSKKQKEAQIKLKELQLKMKDQKINEEMEFKMQQMERDLNVELEGMENELSMHLEMMEDSLSDVLQDIEIDVSVNMEKIEIELEREIENLNEAIEEMEMELEEERK